MDGRPEAVRPSGDAKELLAVLQGDGLHLVPGEAPELGHRLGGAGDHGGVAPLAPVRLGGHVGGVGLQHQPKSTLFNAIAGVFYVDAGTITLDGRDITFLPSHKRSRRIGHLFQDPLKGTAPHMTIEENLAVAYLRSPEKHKSFRRVTRRDRDFFRDALAQLDMGLEDRMNTPVGLLSGGQRQALTLLMATMVTPELLLLDEHTAALDPVTADKVLALTRSVVSERSISCLMITHNMHQALELGTRTLMMDAGRIVLDVSGPERADMTVQGLLDAFAAKAGEAFDNDRVLLSTAEDREN